LATSLRQSHPLHGLTSRQAAMSNSSDVRAAFIRAAFIPIGFYRAPNHSGVLTGCVRCEGRLSASRKSARLRTRCPAQQENRASNLRELARATEHLVTQRRPGVRRDYVTHLLRRSYREGGKVKKETIANLTHVPERILGGVFGACSPAKSSSMWTLLSSSAARRMGTSRRSSP
jgi:hypothetical protein